MGDTKTLRVQNLGPIQEAEVVFGDLTVLVGPQASGKSIFMQLLKVLLDYGPIREEFKRFGIDWQKRWENFLELYFGEGMSEIYRESAEEQGAESEIREGAERPAGTLIQWNQSVIRLSELLTRRIREQEEQMFYIPAQRVLALRDGLTRPFTDYRAGDPFVVREFAEKIHQLVQSEFATKEELFPQERRLKSEYREILNQHIFAGFGLRTEMERFQRRLVLKSPTGRSLSFLVWSAGQREFVPLLLGLYWLIPPTKKSRRGRVEWVAIEELEMGLHPVAISAVMVLVLELLHRGYRVVLSTHSPHILDVVWALQIMQSHQGRPANVLRMFSLPSTGPLRELAEDALKKTYRVYYFRRDGKVVDITGLNPGAPSEDEAGWGGLTEFSGKVGDIIAEVVRQAESQEALGGENGK